MDIEIDVYKQMLKMYIKARDEYNKDPTYSYKRNNLVAASNGVTGAHDGVMEKMTQFLEVSYVYTGHGDDKE